MKIKSSIIDLAILLVLLAAFVFTQPPQFGVTNNSLAAVTSYKMSYYSTSNLTNSTTFTVNFNQSFLRIPDGNNNCTVKIGSITAQAPQCACSNRLCTFKPNYSTTVPSVLQIQIQNITNPTFIYSQIVGINIFYTAINQLNFTVTISSTNYQVMGMIINRVSQSDYGVGYTPVSYTFNISLFYISKNMQMQITIPPEVTFSSITSELSFYSTIQNISPYQIQSLLIFPLQIDAVTNPNGFMILKLSGLGNPRFLGSSASFKITFVQTTAVSNCATCRIAEISTGLQIQSRVPGDVLAVSIESTNRQILAINTISINLQLYAGIPQGGKVSIYLPSEITPVLPVQCGSVYGFTFTDTNPPTCFYNSTANKIDTVNFNTPYFDSTGNGIITIKVYNPLDTRKVTFSFETYDNSGRMIGQSRSAYTFTSLPANMNVTIIKTNQEVDKIFNMSSEIILSKNLKPSQNYIEIEFPAVNYDLNNIQCFSAGQNLNCNKTADPLNQLKITFLPPCSQCSVGNSLKFTINGLRNPSFINDGNQQILINTRSVLGLVQSSQKSIQLLPSSISLSSYTKPISQPVGTDYNLQMTLNLPEYVKANGGQVHMSFSPQSTYSQGLLSNGVYNGPSYSLEIYPNLGSTSLSNSVQYYTQYSPDTIYKIIFNICDGIISACPNNQSNFNFTIKNLKLGYIPNIQTNDTIRITTKFGQTISQKIMDTSSYSPVLSTGALNINVSRSMTNSFSDFQLSFSTSKIVFDKTLTFTLPASLIINGQCSFSSSQGFITSFTCMKSSNSSITITSEFDQNLMMSQNFSYLLTITNVSTPISVAPLNYALETTFKGVKNQRFNVRYSMLASFPLASDYIKSNSTINEEFNLTVIINPVTNLYDSYQIILPKDTSITQQLWLPNLSLTENSTHYILQGVGNMVNNRTTIKAKNTLSTYDQPTCTINLLQGGFLVQQSMISFSNNVPVIIGCNASVTNKTISFLTNLTIICDRNHNGGLNQDQLIVKLPLNGFSYTSATYNGVLINQSNPIAYLAINSTSPRIVQLNITNLKNILYVPNLNNTNYLSNNIKQIEIITARDNGTKILGQGTFTSTTILPVDPYDIKNISSLRSVTRSGQLTNITISYPTIFGSSQHLIQITLPNGQNQFSLGTSGCIYTSGNCNIIDINTTDIRFMLKPNQTITLTKVLNIFPNLNSIAIKIFTYPQYQFVEEGYANIYPVIALLPIQMTGVASSSQVGDISNITLQLKPSQVKIQSTNTIKIKTPQKIYSRAFNNDDCIIKPSFSTTSYTGCTYQFDSSGWLTGITVGTIGPFDIQIGSTLSISFQVTNPWTSYPFTNSSFVATVNKNINSSTSQGSLNISSLYQGLSSFSIVPISRSLSSFSQSNLVSGKSNTLSIFYSIAGNIGKTTKIICLIPKDAFTLPINSSLTLDRQDSSYYYTSIEANCPTAGCRSYSQNISISLQNTYFVKKQRNSLIVYLLYDNLPVSQNFNAIPDYHTPLQVPGYRVSRTSNIGSELTSVTFIFNSTITIPYGNSQLLYGDLTVDISSNITSSRYTNTTYAYNLNSSSNQNSNFNVPFLRTTQNITAIIPSSISNSTSSHIIQINGKNSLEVPLLGQKYWITIQNSSHILFASYNVAFSSNLVPLSQGLSLIRNNTTVGVTSQLKLQGNIPTQSNVNYSLYTVTINNQSYGNISQSLVSLNLLMYTNQPVTNSQPTFSISICNTNFCLYRQTGAIITPALTPIILTNNDLYLSVPNSMNSATLYPLTVNFTKTITNKTFIRFELDSKFVSNINKVTGYLLNQGTQKIEQVSDLTFALDTTSNSQNSKIFVVRSNILGRTINMTSLEITFKATDYQINLINSIQNISFQPPSSNFTQALNISISSTELSSNISCSSNKTGTLANYTIFIQSINKNGVLTIYLPSYMTQIFNNNSPLNLDDDTLHQSIKIQIDGTSIISNGIRKNSIFQTSVNGLYLLDFDQAKNVYVVNIPITQSAGKNLVKLELSNVKNPSNNEPLYFKIYQHQVEVIPALIYGVSQLSYKMTILSPIKIYTAIRNMTKIGSKISLDLDIQIPSSLSADKLSIKLSKTQVLVKGTDSSGNSLTCSICIDGQQCGQSNISFNQTSNSILIVRHRPGRHNYSISGCLINSLFSQEPKIGDEIYASLSLPYQTAQTTPQFSTYITPLVSTGQIKIIEQTSSSNKRTDYTNLKIVIIPQNYLNCDGIYLRFNQLAYIAHKNIQCFINDLDSQFYIINSSTLFIQTPNKASTLKIQIKNIINYIQNNEFSISTMKKKVVSPEVTKSLKGMKLNFNPDQYGIADQINVLSVANSFVPNLPSTRLVFTDPYLSNNQKKIMAISDFSLPAQLPINSLKYAFGSNQLGCSQNLSFNKSLTIYCKTVSTGSVNFYVRLYDPKYESYPLTSFSKSIFIYPSPKESCTNTLCDICSTDQSGNEYCFVCREGLYSSQGKCVNQCPAQKFALNQQTCTECSPQCSKCFDLYQNSCTSCKNTELILDSGSCRTYCTTGFAFQAKYCVDAEQCTSRSGCRRCSSTGFCYQCLPDYIGEPSCTYSQILPKTFFIYWMIPFILLIPIVGIITCIKVGKQTFSHLLIYLLAVCQLMSWIFVIPKMPQQALAMIMCAFLLLKIILSIVSYQTYYGKIITSSKQQKLLENNERQSDQNTDGAERNSKKSKEEVKNEQGEKDEKITHKQRLTRFSGHFLNCDAYELLMNKLGKPYMNIKHYLPYFVLTIISRLIIVVFLIYIMAQYSSSGDLVYLPLISIISGLLILIIRAGTSDKAAACLARIRG